MPTEITPQLPSIPPLPGDLAAEAAASTPYEKDDEGGSTLGTQASTAEECLEDLNQKLPAVTKKHPPPPFKRVIKTSFNFKSDIDTSSSSSLLSNEQHTCGIIHATKSSTSNGEQHVFGWINNINNTNSTQSIINYLHKYGYKSTSTTKFIPYTSKECWNIKYPHATIQFEYVDGNKVVGNVEWESKNNPIILAAAAGKKKKSSSSSKVSKKKKLFSPKLVQRGTLPNLERNELHNEIYNYFHWLHDELVQLETHHTGRRQVSNANISVPALRGLLGKMEGAFKMLNELKEEKEKEQQQREETNTTSIDGASTLPYLEQALELELQHRVLLNNNNSSSSSNSTILTADGEGTPSTNAAASNQPKIDFRTLDFDTLFQKLVDFKAENGHVSPPLKHRELGKWVSELRTNKKLLREKGMEYEQQSEQQQEEDGSTKELEKEAATADEGGEQEPKKKKRKKEKKRVNSTSSNTYLTQVRVQQLDSISFQWTLGARLSWNERFEELRQFKITNGRFPTNKEGTLGNWLKNQRKLYTKQDADFMANKMQKMEELGVPLRQRTYTAKSWDDRFQQLVEFGRVHRHFNVPNPTPDNAEGRVIDPNSEAADQNRFYKFVAKLHADYRAMQRGVPPSVLTDERISMLRNVGFEFTTKPDKSVPEVDWSTRMQHLEAFYSEMGHMRVDPNYDKYANLGGWAASVSEQHRNWQEGKLYLSPDMIEKFNQLSSMGFGFDVFRPRRGERSWDDSFGLLLQYRAETGSTRVPHHYKADFRLGSWVSVQRKEHKLLMEGKPSKLTQERIDRLESVGFEWVARRGQEEPSADL